ncbi:MAG: aldo/keto reductase [Deltaproteobacteria bacterium]|nr:MAG: aldo/keto reductase [Deltaproteobacteria bacterium]
MEYRRLGRSGLKVSSLCLGAMTFGEADENSFMHKVGCDEKTAFQLMNRALEAGVNFFDTADIYGQHGLSERVIGRWFEKERKRDEVILATKFRFTMWEGPNGKGASRYRIMRCVEESLRRLKTDRIDLYQIHMQDTETPIEETLRALDDLIRQGKVLYIGASNYTAYRLMEALWTSEKHSLVPFVSLQAQYSLVIRDLERELVPLCREYGIGILPWSPLAGGFLTGKYRQGMAPPPGSRLAQERWRARYESFDTERNWRIIYRVSEIADEIGATPAQVSLAWLLHQPTVTSVIFGCRSLEQLEDNLKATEISLSEEQRRRLDEASAFDLGYPYDFIKGITGTW